MKTTVLSALAAFAVAHAAQAATLGVFDFNNSAKPNDASYISPCIELCPIDPCGCLTPTWYSSGGPDGSAFTSFNGWDKTQYDPSTYFTRSDVWQFPKTVAFEVSVNDDSLGTISGLSASIQRPTVNSPDTIMASIFWKDDVGTVQYRSSGPVSLVDIGTWDTIDFQFVNGTADIPSGLDYSGEDFLVELYAWGGDGGSLSMDNVVLSGECAPIPEPGGALLLASSGFVLLLRRRRR